MQIEDIPGVVGDPSPADASQRRILFYGGCHAKVLASIFQTYATDMSVRFDYITNFEIIPKKIPFPTEHLSRWSAVVFSPIANKPGYETSRLVEACKAVGVQTVAYPWLEWRGYFPNARKGHFITGDSWHYPSLMEVATKAHDSDLFVNEDAESAFGRKAQIVSAMKSTTEHLMNHEQIHNCDVRISRFILNNYRKSRLFMTPDHPSKVMYDYVCREIAFLLKLQLDQSFFASPVEPQYGIKLPIAPQVAAAMGLKFQDSDYQNVTCAFGARVFPWTDYLRLCFGAARGAKIYRAVAETFVKERPAVSNALSINERYRVQKGQMLHGWMWDKELAEEHVPFTPAWGDKSLERTIDSWHQTLLYAKHWKERGA